MTQKEKIKFTVRDTFLLLLLDLFLLFTFIYIITF